MSWVLPRRGDSRRKLALFWAVVAAGVLGVAGAAYALSNLGGEAGGRSEVVSGDLASARGAGVGEIGSSDVPLSGYASPSASSGDSSGEPEPAAEPVSLGSDVNSVSPGEVSDGDAPGNAPDGSEGARAPEAEGGGSGGQPDGASGSGPAGGGADSGNPESGASGSDTPGADTSSSSTPGGDGGGSGGGEESGSGGGGEAAPPSTGDSLPADPAPPAPPAGNGGESGSGNPGSGNPGGSAPSSEDGEPPHDGMRLTVPEMARVDGAPVIDAAGGEEAAMATSLMHLAGTGFPWQEEEGDTNTFIAGHRLGYEGTGSHLIFYDLDELENGDGVFLQDSSGEVHEYRVYRKFVVEPSDTYIANPVKGKDVVTLQTCTLPDYSDRLVVQAERV